MCFTLPVSAARKAPATIESVKAKVEIKTTETNAWKKARPNAALKTSDTIRTGSKSIARVKLADGSKILLLQNSQAEMENLSSVQRAIKLVKGRIRAVVTKVREGSEFKVKTPIGVASVRGTEFEVEFVDEGEQMAVNVISGQVGVAKLGELDNEILVNPGESIKFGVEGDIGDPIKSGAIPINKQDIVAEVYDSRVKDSIVAMAAEELKNADYQTAKSLIDVDGRRVRVEEYIMRPADNQFKLVALNERDTRFDYFTYTGTFARSDGAPAVLPEDLSTALKDVGGKLGDDAPEYYLTDYEMFMSNTVDSISDEGTGGHLVQIDMNGTGSSAQYTLTHDDGLGNITSTVVDAATLQGDGSYKVYNPVKDTFQLVSASNLDDALKVAVLDEGSYRNLATADTYWKTRYNTNEFRINNVIKSSFAPKVGVTQVLAVDLDVNFTNPAIVSISEFPDGQNTLHNKLTLFYSDGSKIEYDNYIIDDEGKVATADKFDGLGSSAEYQSELLNWNYQQKVKATEMQGDINLVIDPRIGTMSGLIQ